MTSPSRRKRPTILPSSRPETISREPKCGRVGSITLVGYSMAMLLVAVIVDVAAAKELQWRRGRTPARHAAADANSQPSQPHDRSHADTGTRVASRVRRDVAVRPVRYEAESVTARNIAGYEHDGDQLHSVLVDRTDSADRPGAGSNLSVSGDRGRVRAAQLQFSRPETDTRYAEPDSRYQAEAAKPFGNEPIDGRSDLERQMKESLADELFPPLDELPTDDLPQPSDDGLSLPLPTEEPAGEPGPPLQQPPSGGTGDNPLDYEPLPLGTTTFEPPTEPGSFDAGLAPADDGSCKEELAELKASTLHDVDLTISVNGTEGLDYPVECSIDDGRWHPGRCWPQTVYMWKASALCHKPLYFEDEALERYGHSWGPCCDPIVSGAHFFTKLPALPYCMGLNPPCECQYALGHYRPGSCAPYMCDPFPIMSRAALLQAGAVVGTAALLP